MSVSRTPALNTSFHKVGGNVMELSLLRSPKAPDRDCDMGLHRFKYAILPHISESLLSAAVVRESAVFNTPYFYCSAVNTSEEANINLGVPSGLFRIKNADTSPTTSLVIDSIKLAECEALNDSSTTTTYILRVYESIGHRGVAELQYLSIRNALAQTSEAKKCIISIHLCDMLENDLSGEDNADEEIFTRLLEDKVTFQVGYTPFKIITINIVCGNFSDTL
jgi:alpha-mannosidase